MKRLVFFALLLTLAFSSASHAVSIYVTDCDNQTAYILDTNNATFSQHTQVQRQGCAIAVTDRVVVSQWPDNGVVEYDLNFVATGTTWPGSDQWSQMLDGTTDGTNNYSTNWSGGGIIKLDLNFQNGSTLFTAPFSVIGITYDSSNNTLWVINDDVNTIHNFAMDGTELSSFVNPVGGRDCCMAYDPATDSLWVGDHSNTVINYAKDGTQLDSVTFTGWSPSNIWGAEIQMGPATPAGPQIPVPTLSGPALGIMVLLMLLVGGWVVRRQA